MSFPIKIAFYFFLIIWLVFFLAGANSYKDSVLEYSVFSFLFLLLLLSALFSISSFSYLFLSVFLWLGCWEKLTLHSIFSNPYIEPLGLFSLENNSIDPVLTVAIAGCLGMLLGRAVLFLCKIRTTTKITNLLSPPMFYQTHRKKTLLLFLILFVAVAIFNVKYSIFQIGLVPKTTLIWPFNALTAWVLNIGFSIILGIFLNWELKIKKLTFVYILILLEAVGVSISILSRSVYIFHVVPIVVVLALNFPLIKYLSWVKIIILLSLTVGMFFFSLEMVSYSRANFYETEVDTGIFAYLANGGIEAKPNITNEVVMPSFAKTLQRLILDRWLGIEGIMAVYAYPYKSFSLFKEGLMEKPEIGKVDLYQEISKSHYRFIDTKKFSFATLPGSIAFFYYTGSVFFVFISMFLLTCLMVLSERLVFFLTNNTIIGALYGASIAYTVEQLGVFPIGVLKHYIFVFGLFVFIYLVRQISNFKNSLDIPRESAYIR